jgi:hypothetical protein
MGSSFENQIEQIMATVTSNPIRAVIVDTSSDKAVADLLCGPHLVLRGVTAEQLRLLDERGHIPEHLTKLLTTHGLL